MERVQRKRDSLILLMEMHAHALTMENKMAVLRKLKIELPYDPSIPLLGNYLEKTIL